MDYTLVWAVAWLGIFGLVSFGVAYFSQKRIFYLIAGIIFLCGGIIWLWKTRVIFEGVMFGVAAITSFLNWNKNQKKKNN